MNDSQVETDRIAHRSSRWLRVLVWSMMVFLVAAVISGMFLY